MIGQGITDRNHLWGPMNVQNIIAINPVDEIFQLDPKQLTNLPTNMLLMWLNVMK